MGNRFDTREYVDILIHAPTGYGGLAEHVHYQAECLSDKGFSVEVVTGPDFLEGRTANYNRSYILEPQSKLKINALRKIHQIYIISKNFYITSRRCKQLECRLLLLESYIEYFSIFWFIHLRALRDNNVIIGANLHDPIRDFRIGPIWWHEWSMKKSYSTLDFVLTHEELTSEANIPGRIKSHVVPVGVYLNRVPSLSKNEARKLLNIPKYTRVFLSFGFIRDNKNLDIFIHAMQEIEGVYLLVAGTTQSMADKQVAYYIELANKCGISDRVRFDNHFIADDKIPLYFSATDVVLLTYSESFKSQSGVLNIAATYKKPVLASAGEGPLKKCVEEFCLGAFVTPDDIEDLKKALKANKPDSKPNWDGYCQYASWTSNVKPLIERINNIRKDYT